MPGNRSSSTDAFFGGWSGKSTTTQESRKYHDDSVQRYKKDSGDSLIGRLINGDPNTRSYSQSANDQQNSSDGYPTNYSSAARAA